MLPILLIHGYSSEGKNTKVEDIYGNLPADLRTAFGEDRVVAIDLSRWISLNDGIALDDVSFGLERALQSPAHKGLLAGGFHVVIHSTGALVIKNWMRLFERRPSPVANLVHLAGANFGSGLAHIGQGQLARWGRLIFQGVGRGVRVLDELEFGSNKTLDLHTHFLRDGRSLYDDYRVQEFCLIGSQTLSILRAIPIRYVKEDSADNTVRTAAGNLNFNYVTVEPAEASRNLSVGKVSALAEARLGDQRVSGAHYEVDDGGLSTNRREIPFTVLFETAHFGEKIGIVDGSKNRSRVVPLIVKALATPYDDAAYSRMVATFHANTVRTFTQAAKLKNTIAEWDRQAQYEAHSQVVFRLRDQYGLDVEHYDITFRSRGAGKYRLERMIEDKHKNRNNPGTFTFYLRTARFQRGPKAWTNLLHDCKALDIEITGHEPKSGDIEYLPLTIELRRRDVPDFVQQFRTTVVDVTLLRLPSRRVFAIKRARP